MKEIKKSSTGTLPPLVKNSSVYKLIIPEQVEEKIRYLIRKFPSTEWSGVLFYTHEGNFVDNNLVITCKDIYPMDLGSSGWTEFRMSEDVAAYIADNIELFDCEIGLVHSHHSMGAFFSGQDVHTLQAEGNDTNCFLSLIVDTKGTYVAAITRKVISTSEVTINTSDISYNFFGDEVISEENDAPLTKTIKKECIEYFMLDVERHQVKNDLDYLDRRFEEIRKKKEGNKPLDIYPRKYRQKDFFEEWKEDLIPSQPKEYISKNKPEKQVSGPDPIMIHNAAISMVTCSFIVNTKKFDLKQWIKKHMMDVYERIFPSGFEGEEFMSWLDFIIDHILVYFPDKSLDEEPDRDVIILEALLSELDIYRTENPYMEIYCNRMEEILNEY